MKKTISLLFALTCVLSLSAKTIYLNTGGSKLWNQANAEFFVHAWGAGDTDVHMTLLTGDIYQAEIPDGSTKCLFTRQKTGSTTIIWDKNNGLWNLTEDLTIGTNNCFTITGWGSGDNAKSTGTWSTYTPAVTPEPDTEDPDTPVTKHDTLRIYCKMTHSWWTDASAAVGIYSYKGNTGATAWPGVRMTAVAGETGLWYADVDVTAYPSVVFTRVNGSGTIADWGAKTSDQTIPTDGKNLFTITSSTAVWGDPGCTGTWSTYTPSTAPVIYYLTGDAGLVGKDNEWKEKAIELGEASTEAPASYKFESLAAGTYQFKITDGTWDVSYGYSAVDKTCTSDGVKASDKDDNIQFTLASAGDVTVTFDGKKICVTLPSATPTDNTTITVLDTNAPIYNLLGVQVDSNYKGIVIQNGHKFVQK